MSTAVIDEDGTTTYTSLSSSSSSRSTSRLNGQVLVEIYRTAHWIWYSNLTLYDQNKQYIDPLLNWPETSYSQIGQWLGLTISPGKFDGGRRAVFVDPSLGYIAWTSNGNIGISFQVFSEMPDWAWVVVPHEIANIFSSEAVSGGWPTDWWADGRSPFPAMAAVQVEKANNVAYWSAHDEEDSGDPQYVMFRDRLLGVYGWSLFQKAFTSIYDKSNGEHYRCAHHIVATALADASITQQNLLRHIVKSERCQSLLYRT